MYCVASQSISEDQTKADLFHNYLLDLWECMQDSIAFHAEMMGDFMYFHQAIKQPDTQEIAKAIVKEVEVHIKDEHWTCQVVRSTTRYGCATLHMGNGITSKISWPMKSRSQG